MKFNEGFETSVPEQYNYNSVPTLRRHNTRSPFTFSILDSVTPQRSGKALEIQEDIPQLQSHKSRAGNVLHNAANQTGDFTPKQPKIEQNEYAQLEYVCPWGKSTIDRRAPYPR